MVELVMDLPSAISAAAPEVRARSYQLPDARPEEALPNSQTTVRDQVTQRDAQATSNPASSVDNTSASNPTSDSSATGEGSGRERILSLEEQYALQLRSLFEAKKSFPVMARKLGKEGRVTLQLVLGSNGSVLQYQVAESSGSEVLDQAALRLVNQIGEFPPFPEEIKRTNWQFFIPIEYRL